MNCPSCRKEVVADRFFCTWCEAFMPNPRVGTKAGLFRRWFATSIDPLLAFLLWLVVVVVVGGILGTLEGGLFGSFGVTILAIVIVTIGYGIFYLKMLSQGATPGKWIMGEQVVNKADGGFPGLGRMFVREIVGKFVSGIFLGIGYFWAIFDPDSQAWHDKIAGTVVVKKSSFGELPSPLGAREPSLVREADYQSALRKAADGTCPSCSGRNPPTSNFCGYCGARLK